MQQRPTHLSKSADASQCEVPEGLSFSAVVSASATITALLLATAVSFAADPPPEAAVPSPSPTARQLPKAPANGEMGFVISLFGPAIYPGMNDNCPQGYVTTNSDNYLASLPIAERARLMRKENEKEFEQRWKASAVPSAVRNVCTNYDQFPERPIQKTLRGKIAYGIDLDGDDGKSGGYSCPHESFVSPTGEKGIDNQAYRVLGCTHGWRSPDGAPGEVIQQYKNFLMNGGYTIVMFLRDVHSLENSDDVQVIIASSEDAPVVDARQAYVTGVTYKISSNLHWRNVLHGHIKDGVLTTDPGDIVLSRPILGGPRARRAEWDFSRSHLRVAFGADGPYRHLGRISDTL